LRPRAALALGVDSGAVEGGEPRRRHAPVAAITGLPGRQPEPLPDVIPAIAPVVAGMAIDDEVVAR